MLFRSRIALIVLDSTIEIAFKEYLVNDSGTYYSDAQLLTIFKTRHAVHTEIKKYVKFPPKLWKKISHLSDNRNKLVHQRATGGVSDSEIEGYRDVVEAVLRKLYKLKLSK